MEDYGVFSEALKWTALVFAAGFVGYFGKYLGIKIISLFHRDEGGKTGMPEKFSAGSQAAKTSEPLAPVPEESLTGDALEEAGNSGKKQDKEQLKHAKKLGKAIIKQQKKQKNP